MGWGGGPELIWAYCRKDKSLVLPGTEPRFLRLSAHVIYSVQRASRRGTVNARLSASNDVHVCFET